MSQNVSLKEIEKNLFKIEIENSDLILDVDKIVVSLGYNLKEMPVHFYNIIENIVKEFPNKNSINAGFKIIDLQSNSSDKTLVINEIELNVDKIIFHQLKNSEKAALFLVTIGSQMEKWSKETTSNGDPVSGFLIDSVASSAVELIADILHDSVRDYFRLNDLNITNRYSPGYCNWSVLEQNKLFSLFPGNFCGVSLTDTSLMIPIKSISGIIGIGRNVEYNEYLCDRCGVKDCSQRIYLNRKNKIVKNNIGQQNDGSTMESTCQYN